RGRVRLRTALVIRARGTVYPAPQLPQHVPLPVTAIDACTVVRRRLLPPLLPVGHAAAPLKPSREGVEQSPVHTEHADEQRKQRDDPHRLDQVTGTTQQ